MDVTVGAVVLGTGVGALLAVFTQRVRGHRTVLAGEWGPSWVAALDLVGLVLTVGAAVFVVSLVDRVWLAALFLPAVLMFAHSIVVALEARHHVRMPAVSHTLDGAVVSDVQASLETEVRHAVRLAAGGTIALLGALTLLALVGGLMVVEFFLDLMTWSFD